MYKIKLLFTFSVFNLKAFVYPLLYVLLYYTDNLACYEVLGTHFLSLPILRLFLLLFWHKIFSIKELILHWYFLVGCLLLPRYRLSSGHAPLHTLSSLLLDFALLLLGTPHHLWVIFAHLCSSVASSLTFFISSFFCCHFFLLSILMSCCGV